MLFYCFITAGTHKHTKKYQDHVNIHQNVNYFYDVSPGIRLRQERRRRRGAINGNKIKKKNFCQISFIPLMDL